MCARQVHRYRRDNRTYPSVAAAQVRVLFTVRTRPWHATERSHASAMRQCIQSFVHHVRVRFPFQWLLSLSSLLWGISSRYALMGHVTLKLGPTFGPSSPMDDGTYRQGPTWLHRYWLPRLQGGVESVPYLVR